jgi:hypothetical protein
MAYSVTGHRFEPVISSIVRIDWSVVLIPCLGRVSPSCGHKGSAPVLAVTLGLAGSLAQLEANSYRSNDSSLGISTSLIVPCTNSLSWYTIFRGNEGDIYAQLLKLTVEHVHNFISNITSRSKVKSVNGCTNN